MNILPMWKLYTILYEVSNFFVNSFMTGKVETRTEVWFTMHVCSCSKHNNISVVYATYPKLKFYEQGQRKNV